MGSAVGVGGQVPRTLTKRWLEIANHYRNSRLKIRSGSMPTKFKHIR